MAKSISLICPINKLSYGYTSVNILRELSKQVKVALWPIGQIEVEEQDIASVKEALGNSQSFDYDAPSLRIYHQNSLDVYPGRGLRIGFPIFELDEFTEHEKHNLEFPDKLFVCSDWAKRIVDTRIYPLTKIYNPENDKRRIALEQNTHVIPLGVDINIFKPEPINEGKTIFINIGKWEKRKGHDILIKAFREEFGDDNNVMLLLVTANRFLNIEQNAEWMKLIGNAKNIHVIPRQNNLEDIAQIINMSDCGIFPSHAEGWNLPALETLACGRHLIITDYSAHQMYANEQNSRLIPITRLELAQDDIWFHGQGCWAKIDDEQIRVLKSHMRDIHNDKQGGKLALNEAGIKTAQQFTWTNTANKIMEHI